MVPKQCQEKNDRQRHTQEPQQRSSSEIHLVSPSLQRRKTLLTDIGSLGNDRGKFSLLPAGRICGAEVWEQMPTGMLLSRWAAAFEQRRTR
jgi:hypothetical protein